MHSEIRIKGLFLCALFFLIFSCAGSKGASGVAAKKTPLIPEAVVELPPSLGTNPFAGNSYTARNFKAEFSDGQHLTLWTYDKQDECWQKDLSLTYSVNSAKSMLYAKVESVYKAGERLSSAKSLSKFLWPTLKKNCKNYLNSTDFDSASKKIFLNHTMENLERSSSAQFGRLYTYYYKFLDGGKKIELTAPLETGLFKATDEQIIGIDKAGKVQLAFSNLTVQLLALQKEDNALPEGFFIGNCDIDSKAKKLTAEMFYIQQKEEDGRTVFKSMQEAGIFEASYSVKAVINREAEKQHYSAYDCIYTFTVTSFPTGLPPLDKIEIPVLLHTDKYVFKKEQNPSSLQ